MTPSMIFAGIVCLCVVILLGWAVVWPPKPRSQGASSPDAADRRYRRNVWAVAVCGLVAFWTLVAAAIVGVVS